MFISSRRKRRVFSSQKDRAKLVKTSTTDQEIGEKPEKLEDF